jgi:hypothetical protein
MCRSMNCSTMSLGLTQNCIPPSEIIIVKRECVIRFDIGVGANVLFKQVCHTIRYPVVAVL